MRAKKKKGQIESDDSQGAPEWMVTFSDCMTLLLTFFVLLLSFSSFDDDILAKLRIIHSKTIPLTKPPGAKSKESFVPEIRVRPETILSEGSEKPTLEIAKENTAKKEEDLKDFRKLKHFTISSEKIFWYKGNAISTQGSNNLSTLGAFLKEVPNQIVINENTGAGAEAGEDLSLSRAWAVIKYLTEKHNIDKNRFSLSAGFGPVQKNLNQDRLYPSRAESKRTLEIVLLERSICN